MTTHIIVKDAIENKQREKYLNRYNKNIKFVKIDWLIECLAHGKKMEEEEFHTD